MFYILHQFRKGLCRSHTDQDMYMVRHTINSDQFMVMIMDDACYIVVEIIFPDGRNDSSAVFDGKNELEMNLGIGVWHFSKSGNEAI